MEHPQTENQEQIPQTATTQKEGVIVGSITSDSGSDGQKKGLEAEKLPVIAIASEEDSLKKEDTNSVVTVPSSGATSPEKAKEARVVDGKMEMTPAELRAFRNEGLRVVIGGMLIHLVIKLLLIFVIKIGFGNFLSLGIHLSICRLFLESL